MKMRQRETDHKLSIKAEVNLLLELMEYIVLCQTKHYSQQESLGYALS